MFKTEGLLLTCICIYFDKFLFRSCLEIPVLKNFSKFVDIGVGLSRKKKEYPCSHYLNFISMLHKKLFESPITGQNNNTNIAIKKNKYHKKY